MSTGKFKLQPYQAEYLKCGGKLVVKCDRRLSDADISTGLHRLSIDLIKSALTGQPQTIAQIASKAGIPVVTVERLIVETGAVQFNGDWIMFEE